MREVPGRELLEALVDHFRDRELLLILDNCEHVLQSVATVSSALLNGTRIRILATSREALGLLGERVYRMPSLDLPSRDGGFDDIAASPAVRLFVERARGVQPAFQITAETAGTVAELCRKLDGLPLALELAAAKVKVLNVSQIAARVDDRFRLLTGGSRAAVPRQQTLRALVDWSYDLLNAEERRLLRELSVFGGGWTLEGAEAICQGDVLDLLAALVDKSLVSFEGRYGMLETVRQYALEKAIEQGEVPELRRRHRAYYLRFAEQAADALRGPHQAEYLQALDVEHGNLRVALESCADDPEGASTGLRLASALRLFWDNRGHYSEGRVSLARALAHAGVSHGSKEEADALCNAAILAWNQADYEASRTMQERALQIRQSLGEPQGIAESLLCLGSQAYREGNPGVAQTLLFAALGMSGDSPVLRCQVLLWLGIESLQRRALGEARAQLTESLQLAEQIGWGRAIAMARYDLADVELHSGEFDVMREYLDGALEFADELGTFTVFVIESYAELASAQEQDERAARLLGASEAFRERKSLALPEDNRLRLVAVRDLAMARLGDRFKIHYSAGRATAWDEILFEARHEGRFAAFRQI
jgi:non-specific serine/threonine protein kinase